MWFHSKIWPVTKMSGFKVVYVTVHPFICRNYFLNKKEKSIFQFVLEDSLFSPERLKESLTETEKIRWNKNLTELNIHIFQFPSLHKQKKRNTAIFFVGLSPKAGLSSSEASLRGFTLICRSESWAPQKILKAGVHLPRIRFGLSNFLCHSHFGNDWIPKHDDCSH